MILLQPVTALVYVWDGIGIGASSFRFLAASMVVALLLTVGCLVAIGDTLVGVWVAVAVLSLSRLGTFVWWYSVGPLAPGRDPSPVSQGA